MKSLLLKYRYAAYAVIATAAYLGLEWGWLERRLGVGDVPSFAFVVSVVVVGAAVLAGHRALPVRFAHAVVAPWAASSVGYLVAVGTDKLSATAQHIAASDVAIGMGLLPYAMLKAYEISVGLVLLLLADQFLSRSSLAVGSTHPR